MSLAFDKQGKPFAFSRRSKRLLVRLFRNPGARGTCSQVLGADGQPLYVDPETDYLEFRRAVNHVPGLYRLDQCDDDGNELEDTQAAYVSIDLARNGTGGDGAVDVSPLVIIQQMAATQADVMKTMAAQQAALIAATAEILRAPYRPAPIGTMPELRNADASNDRDDEDDDDDEDDEPATPEHPATVALRMMEPYLPQFGAFLYEQFIKFMQSRKSATPPAAAPIQVPASVSMPAATPHPTQEPVSPAAATSSTSAAQSAPVVVAATDNATAVKPPLTAPSATTTKPTSNPTANAPTAAPATSGATMNSHDQLAHLYAIREQLSAKERAIAEHAIAHMDAETHAHWLAELSAMSIDEAATMIRTMIAQLPPPSQ